MLDILLEIDFKSSSCSPAPLFLSPPITSSTFELILEILTSFSDYNKGKFFFFKDQTNKKYFGTLQV
jgi:hypothetical protein